MVVLRRRRAVRHAQVALGAKGEETLQPGTRVLRTLALVPVGQKEREAGALTPLGQSRKKKLVDDHFGAVGEVAALRLPQHQRVLGLHRVAVFEAEAGVLGQGAVVQLDRKSTRLNSSHVEIS